VQHRGGNVVTYFAFLRGQGEAQANEDVAVTMRSGDLKTNWGSPINHPAPTPLDRPQGIEIKHEFVWIDPAIGGRAAPGTVNKNFSTGQHSLNHTTNHSTGAVSTPGSPLSNPVIGAGGRTSRATRQYQGVQAQVANFDTSSIDSAAAFVGLKLNKREIANG
jgi:hypothetical protein